MDIRRSGTVNVVGQRGVESRPVYRTREDGTALVQDKGSLFRVLDGNGSMNPRITVRLADRRNK